MAVLLPYTNSHLQLLVPAHYKHGGSPLSSLATVPPLYDGDPNTTKDMSGTVAVTGQWNYGTDPVIVWAFIDSHSDDFSSGYHSFVLGGATKNISEVWEERGYTGQFTVASSNQLNRTGSGERSVLLRLSNSNAVANARFASTAVAGGTPLVRGCVFSEDFSIPMFDRRRNSEYVFENVGGRNVTGQLLPNISVAKSRQMITRRSFSWSGLTASETDQFQLFAQAFGGNIQQPFVMCIMHGSLTDQMTFYRLLIDQSNLSIKLARNGEYSVSFTALQLSPDY